MSPLEEASKKIQSLEWMKRRPGTHDEVSLGSTITSISEESDEAMEPGRIISKAADFETPTKALDFSDEVTVVSPMKNVTSPGVYSQELLDSGVNDADEVVSTQELLDSGVYEADEVEPGHIIVKGSHAHSSPGRFSELHIFGKVQPPQHNNSDNREKSKK